MSGAIVLANLTLVCWTVWSVPINELVKFIVTFNVTAMCWDVVIMCEKRITNLFHVWVLAHIF